MLPKGSEFSRFGDAGLARADKTSADILSAIYGSFVSTLHDDFENDAAKVNDEILKFGKSIGRRMADEVLSKFGLAATCTKFVDVCEAVTKLGLRLYFGAITETVLCDSPNKFVFRLGQSNIAEFVDPADITPTLYHNVIVGGVIGALVQLGWPVTGYIAEETLQGGTYSIFCFEVLSDSK